MWRLTPVIDVYHHPAYRGREIVQLLISPGAVLLRAEGIDIDAEGRPIQFLITRFPGDRVELLV